MPESITTSHSEEKKTQMNRHGEVQGTVAVREGNFLYCLAPGLQGDNQFRNNDTFTSFEVSEEN